MEQGYIKLKDENMEKDELMGAFVQLVEQLKKSEDAAREEREKRSEDISKILLILMGNGSPETGLVFKVSQLLTWMERHSLEHKEERSKVKTKEEIMDERRWDIISGIIKWIIPPVIYALILLLADILQV